MRDVTKYLDTQYSTTVEITKEQVYSFAAASGDYNPVHFDEQYAKMYTPFDGTVIHGGLLFGIVSKVLGTEFPGEGTILTRVSLEFIKPVEIGDIVCITLEPEDGGTHSFRSYENHGFLTINVKCKVLNTTRMKGNVTVLVPDEIDGTLAQMQQQQGIV